MPAKTSFFIINFGWHHYQYHYHTRADQFPCEKCDQIYDDLSAHMIHFLQGFLTTNNILVALEEGGICLDIISELQRLSLQRTILLEAIRSLPQKNIFHSFVDITQDEVVQLIENKKIQTCTDLQNKHAQLRDPYIAKHAIEIFSQNPHKNGLLLCGGRHFHGVTQHFEEYSKVKGMSLEGISLPSYPWYKTEPRIWELHCEHAE